MSTQVQYRRGSNVEVAAFTGAVGELLVDTTNKLVVVSDGSTAGGFPQVGLTASQTLTNKIYQGTSLSVTGNVTGGNLSGTSIVGTLTTAAQTNITSVGTLGALSVTGNITFGGSLVDTAALEIITASNGNITLSPNGTGVIVANKDIRNGQGNGIGNIGTTGGFFNTIFAKATSAQYADLAEKYTADADYPPGTVVSFGGAQEVTISSQSHATQVAGVVSTQPAYTMNDGLISEHTAMVALTGRVPCLIWGPIAKGDRLVASHVPGHAQLLDPAQYEPGCIIGKALEDYPSTSIGTIEVAVGRF